MENLILLNFLTLAIAVSAFTYTNILTDTGMILENVNKWLDKRIYGRFRWFYTILIGCQFCVGGQWALWYFIYFTFKHGGYAWELHIWFIMQTIFVTKIVTWLYYEVLDKHPIEISELKIDLPPSAKKQLTTKK